MKPLSCYGVLRGVSLLVTRHIVCTLICRCYIDFTNMFPSGQLTSQILYTVVQVCN